MSEKQRVVVLGNGMAGARFIEELLANDLNEKFDITVFGDEPGGNYNRILLSSVLAGKHSADDIVMNSVEWYAQNGVTLHAGVKATNIDATSQIVTTDDGHDTAYDQLVIATGSTAFIPPFEGARPETIRVKLHPTHIEIHVCEIGSYQPRQNKADLLDRCC